MTDTDKTLREAAGELIESMSRRNGPPSNSSVHKLCAALADSANELPRAIRIPAQLTCEYEIKRDAPFTPPLTGNNDGIVRDKHGWEKIDCRGHENYAAFVAWCFNQTVADSADVALPPGQLHGNSPFDSLDCLKLIDVYLAAAPGMDRPSLDGVKAITYAVQAHIERLADSADAPEGPSEWVLFAMEETVSEVLRFLHHDPRIVTAHGERWRDTFRNELNRLDAQQEEG